MTHMNQVVETGYGGRWGRWGVRNTESSKMTRCSETKMESIIYGRTLALRHLSILTIYDRKHRIIRIEDYAHNPPTITIPKY